MRILVAESKGFPRQAAALLRKIGHVRFADLDRRGLLRSLKGVQVLWVRLRNHVDAEVFRAAPELRFIATPTTGLTHIDYKEAERRGVQVISLRGETRFLKNIRATAEHTVALTLALLRNLPSAASHALGGRWDRDKFVGREIYGKTVGIVGYGRLGRIAAKFFKAFGAQVLVTDPVLKPGGLSAGVKCVPLPELLACSDIVSLHVNLTDANVGFFSKACFNRMRRGAWFINTSRGELVDERALITALDSGHLAGAALDVICGEFNGDIRRSPLLRYAAKNSNLLITPHIGGCTLESKEKTEFFLAEKLAKVILTCRD